MRRDLLDYSLPQNLIATRPAAERDGARLLVMDRSQPPDQFDHALVRDLDRLLPPRALVVVNDTRVLKARLLGFKTVTGGKVELLLLDPIDLHHHATALQASGHCVEGFRALGRASKPLRPGMEITFDEQGMLRARIVDRCDDGMLQVLLISAQDVPIAQRIETHGHIPLPPYLGRPDDASDADRYQTIFARVPGAVAAPTAGLHLSTNLIERLRAKKISLATITLHVGPGTFQPVAAEDLDDHPMHAESYDVPSATTDAIAQARQRHSPVVAIGTTVVRALESAADPDHIGHVKPFAGNTRLLIQPGYSFRVVDALLTNFHLPCSTLLALVFAFAGRERTLLAYQAAIDHRYRFYSYGDAMLIHDFGGPWSKAL